MTLIAREIDQRIIAEEAERRYIRERLRLLKLRMKIIMMRRKAAPGVGDVLTVNKNPGDFRHG